MPLCHVQKLPSYRLEGIDRQAVRLVGGAQSSAAFGFVCGFAGHRMKKRRVRIKRRMFGSFHFGADNFKIVGHFRISRFHVPNMLHNVALVNTNLRFCANYFRAPFRAAFAGRSRASLVKNISA